MGWGRVFDLFYVEKNTCIYFGLKLHEYLGPLPYILILLSKEKGQFTTPYGGAFVPGVIFSVQWDPFASLWVYN
jgi:hypothetical protein